MIEVTNKLMAELSSGNITWLVLFLSVGIIWHCLRNIKQIQDFLHAHRKQQVDRLIEALKCEHLDDSFKTFLKQELNNEYWYYLTNIAAASKYRESIMSLHKATHDELPFVHYRRARRYLKFKDGQYHVLLKWHDIFGYYANIAVALIFGFIGLVVCLSAAILKADSTTQIPQLVGFGILFLVVAFFSISQTSSVYSARLIKESIDSK